MKKKIPDLRKKTINGATQDTAIRLSAGLKPDLNPAFSLSSVSWRTEIASGQRKDQIVKEF